MKQEDFEYLKQFEDRFNTATKANYARGIQSKDVEKIRDIYSEIIGQPYKMNTGCSTCVLKLLQKVSPYYYEFKNDRGTKTEIIGEGSRTQENYWGKTEEEQRNSGTDRCGDQETRNLEETGERKGKKANRGRPKKGVRN